LPDISSLSALLNDWEKGLLSNLLASGRFDVKEDSELWVELPGPAEIWENENLEDWFDDLLTPENARVARSLVFTRLDIVPAGASRLWVPGFTNGESAIGHRLGVAPHGAKGNDIWE
jgi:hypothetical protein